MDYFPKNPKKPTCLLSRSLCHQQSFSDVTVCTKKICDSEDAPECLILEVNGKWKYHNSSCTVEMHPIGPFWEDMPVFRCFVLDSPWVSDAYKDAIRCAVEEARATFAPPAPRPLDAFSIFVAQKFSDDPMGLPTGPMEAMWRLLDRGDADVLSIPWMGDGALTTIGPIQFKNATPATRALMSQLARAGRIIPSGAGMSWFVDEKTHKFLMTPGACSFIIDSRASHGTKRDVLGYLAKSGRLDDFAENLQYLKTTRDLKPAHLIAVVSTSEEPTVATLVENHLLAHPDWATLADLSDLMGKVEKEKTPALFRAVEDACIVVLQSEVPILEKMDIFLAAAMNSSIRVIKIALENKLHPAMKTTGGCAILATAVRHGASDAAILALTAGMTRREAILHALSK